MRLLHAIINRTAEAWVWASPFGANGRALGAGQDTWNPLPHIYRVERGEPPPMPTGNEATEYQRINARQARYYWHPWNSAFYRWTPEQVLTPLCGRIRTASRRPHINPFHQSYRNEGQPVRGCPDCTAIAVTRGLDVRTMQQVKQADPWNQLRTNARDADWFVQPDPVSGL